MALSGVPPLLDIRVGVCEIPLIVTLPDAVYSSVGISYVNLNSNSPSHNAVNDNDLESNPEPTISPIGKISQDSGPMATTPESNVSTVRQLIIDILIFHNKLI
jgi:hypothetical protein